MRTFDIDFVVIVKGTRSVPYQKLFNMGKSNRMCRREEAHRSRLMKTDANDALRASAHPMTLSHVSIQALAYENNPYP